MRAIGDFALISAAVALAGCASSAPATSAKVADRVSSQSSRVLQFDIEKGSPSGEVKAFNTISGEHFTGQYAGDAKSLLTGDKGGALTCSMKIETPADPHGTGRCEDNKGAAYRVQF